MQELQPEHVILVHGEASKMEELAVGLKKDLGERYNRGLVDVGFFYLCQVVFYT